MFVQNRTKNIGVFTSRWQYKILFVAKLKVQKESIVASAFQNCTPYCCGKLDIGQE
jgi:hypothetical protein